MSGMNVQTDVIELRDLLKELEKQTTTLHDSQKQYADLIARIKATQIEKKPVT